MTLRIAPCAIDAPDAALLVERVQQEYERRYGGRDSTPVSTTDFAPPDGAFLVAYLDGVPAGCGGVRLVGPGLAEVKRMYVEPQARGRGIARSLLTELEAAAGILGARRVRLETGNRQPEAIALYTSSGYTPIEKFGVYAEEPGSRCYGKALAAPDSS